MSLIYIEYLRDDFTGDEQYSIFKLIEQLHDNGATIFCTLLRKENWYNHIDGEVHTNAVMDKIVHNFSWVYAGDVNMR